MKAGEIIKNISSNLKKCRKEKGVTQYQVIKDIGEENISLRSYKKYESGSTTYVPLLDKLSLLADYFGVTIDYLVTCRPSSFDDSFTKEDSLKRLGRLIYSLVLIPFKDDDSNSQFFGKYYFLSFDDEIASFLDQCSVIASEHNRSFEKKGVNKFKGIEDFDSIARKIPDLEDDWSPSKKRMDSILLEYGLDPKEFLENWKERIIKKRQIEKKKEQL